MITLNAAAIQTHTQGGAVIETNDTAAVLGALFNFADQTVQLRLDSGAANGQAFVSGSRTQPVNVILNLADGRWQFSDGSRSGQLTAPQLNNLNNAAKNIRNGLENFSINSGIAPGTQVPW